MVEKLSVKVEMTDITLELDALLDCWLSFVDEVVLVSWSKVEVTEAGPVRLSVCVVEMVELGL